jgi:hypothetical protein
MQINLNFQPLPLHTKVKKSFPLLTLALLLALLGCKKDGTVDPCTEHEVATCTTDPNKANIRLRNVSSLDYCNVQTNICCGNVNHGNLAAGATSCYRAYEQAWPNVSFNFSVAADSFQQQIIDHVGDTLLPPGNYTYEISVSDYAIRRVSAVLKTD